VTGDPLDQLRDWHLPAPIDWWPPAPGWWALAVLVLIAGVLMAGWRRRHRPRAGRVTRSALRELSVLRASVRSDGDMRGFVAAVSRLLRRLALARYPREQVAGLTGEAWLAFLDATGGGEGFQRGPGRALADLAYGACAAGEPPPNPDALAELAEAWIRANRRQGRPAMRAAGATHQRREADAPSGAARAP
jgi:hypothetical protein